MKNQKTKGEMRKIYKIVTKFDKKFQTNTNQKTQQFLAQTQEQSTRKRKQKTKTLAKTRNIFYFKNAST